MIEISYKANGYKATKCMACEESIPKEEKAIRIALGKTGIFHLHESCANFFIREDTILSIKEGNVIPISGPISGENNDGV